MNWRRWIAMLCIALLGFVVFEETSPAHAAAISEACVSYNYGSSHESSLQSSTEREQSPASPAQTQHHCCAAHCGGGATPATSGVSIFAQASVLVFIPRQTDGASVNAPDGLERPPKATAIV